jgi:ribosomal protein L37E
MAELILTKRELASLIQDGIINIHCPNCAANVYLRLESLTYTKPAPEQQKKSEETATTKCVECGKPISEYAYAVRKGLCPNCWGLSKGAASSKPP